MPAMSWRGCWNLCSLPLVMDSYQSCNFGCEYCYAKEEHAKHELIPHPHKIMQKMKREGYSQTDIDRLFSIRGRENPYEEKRPLNIFLIRPSTPLGGGPGGLNFEPVEMREMLTAGQQEAGQFIAALDITKSPWA